MTYTTFHNVTISILASTPKQAYDVLCERLGNCPGADWRTDTYTTSDAMDDHRETHELFPLCEAETEEPHP